jgi:hypothetical protein
MPRFASLAAGFAAAASVLSMTLPIAEAQPVAHPGNICFRLNEIQNSHQPDFRTLYIRTSSRGYFRVNFAADCNNVGTEPLIIHPISNDGWICGPASVNISVRGTHQGCMPIDITRLTPAEVDAIPPRDRP